MLEDDDICVVAKLLGDLMAYRASGTGHLELVAGYLFTLQSEIYVIYLCLMGKITSITVTKVELYYTSNQLK